MILNAGPHRHKALYDEKTLSKIQGMDILVQEIISNIKTLEKMLDSYNESDPDYEVLKEHVKSIIEIQIEPIIEHMN